MATDYCVIVTTCPDQQEASELARKLVEQQLAACVQLLAINSVYSWEGRVESGPEVLLLIKSRTSRYADVETFIQANHSYSVPEILRLPIADGSAGYLQWLGSLVAPADSGS